MADYTDFAVEKSAKNVTSASNYWDNCEKVPNFVFSKGFVASSIKITLDYKYL